MRTFRPPFTREKDIAMLPSDARILIAHDQYYPALMDALAREITQAGGRVRHLPHTSVPLLPQAALYDGVMFFAETTDPIHRWLLDSRLPAVRIYQAGPPDRSFPVVAVDDLEMGRIGARHLIGDIQCPN